MNTRRIVSIVAFGVATSASAVTFAQSNASRSPWMAAIEVGPSWHHDASFTSFRTSRSAPPFSGLDFGRDLAHLGGRFTLAADVSWNIEATQGRVRQAFDTQLTTHHLQGAVTLRAELTSWLTPYARLAGGAAYLIATVKDDLGSPLSTDAWVPYGSAGAGVMVTSGTWFTGIGARTLRVVVAIEGGYQLVMPTALQVSQPAPGNTRSANDRIGAQGVSLGTLDPSAAYLRVAVGFRF